MPSKIFWPATGVMAQQRPPESKPSDLGVRLLSAAFLVPPVIAAIYFGTPYFEALVLVGGAILIYELFRASGGQLSWTFGGLLYISAAVFSLLALRAAEGFGAITIYWLFILVWSADTAAYFMGRSLGGPKLAPKLSPNKTWSGFIGALLGAAIVGAGVGLYLEKPSVWLLIVVSAILGAVSQVGDLLESSFKRRFDKKDMSGLIPGHGGLFDRVDGLLAAALAAWCGQMISKKELLAWL